MTTRAWWPLSALRALVTFLFLVTVVVVFVVYGAALWILGARS